MSDLGKYYAALGLQHGDSKKRIRSAFLKLSLKLHPDKNPDNLIDATEKFKVINEAYQILTSPSPPPSPPQSSPPPEEAAPPPEEAPPPRPPPLTYIKTEERITLFDLLCLEMATGANLSPETTFESDLKRLTDYFIRRIIVYHQIDPKNIETIFSDFFDVIKEQLIKYPSKFKTNKLFDRINNTSYYTFHNPQNIRHDRLWYDGARLIINNAIKIIKDNPDDYTPEKIDDIIHSNDFRQDINTIFFGRGPKKRTTRRPLRRKSGTKRLRRRRSNRRRTSRK